MNRRVYLERDQRWVDCDTPLGVGGQGSFCPVIGEPKLGVKFYKTMTPTLSFRLGEIVRRRVTHRSMAWPIDRVRSAPGGEVLGVLLERVVGVSGLVILDATLAARKGIHVTNRMRTWVAKQFVMAVEQIHHDGYCLDDINESNVVLESNAHGQLTDKPRVVLIDLDGSLRFTVRDPQTGRIGPCAPGVARSEFLPPEILKLGNAVDFKTVDRNSQHDLFAVAVLVWMFLTGVHPYSARNTNPQPKPQEITEWIRLGWWPWMPVGQMPTGWIPHPGSVLAFHQFPPNLRDWFSRCFHDGSIEPSLRPSLSSLIAILDHWHRKQAKTSWRNVIVPGRWCLDGFQRLAKGLGNRISLIRHRMRQFDAVSYARFVVLVGVITAIVWSGFHHNWSMWWKTNVKSASDAAEQSLSNADNDPPRKLPSPQNNPYVDPPSRWMDLLENRHERQ